jgi:hypothetical protein
MNELRTKTDILLINTAIEVQINWEDLINIVEIVDFIVISLLECGGIELFDLNKRVIGSLYDL